MDHDNPAERLLRILKKGKEFRADLNCRKVWQDLFGVQDESLLLVRLGKVVALPLEIVVLLRREYPSTEKTWDHWYSHVLHAFGSQALGGQWATFISHIDNHTITGLQLSAALLQAKSSVSVIEKERLSDLRKRLSDIFEEVKDAGDISTTLKISICRMIQKIITAIDEYSITGIDGIGDALETMVGHISMNPNATHFVKRQGLGKKLLDILKGVRDTVGAAQDIKEIGADVSDLLDLF